MEMLALRTPTKVDDKIVAAVKRFYFYIGGALAFVRAFTPRVTLGQAPGLSPVDDVDGRRKVSRISSISLLLPALAAAMLVGGCGPSAVQHAQSFVSVSSMAVVETDQVVAAEYALAAEQALAAASSMDDYRGRMERWDEVETALVAARASVLVLQRAVDAWDAGGREGFAAAAPCVAGALLRVATLVEGLGVELPSALSTALRNFGPMIDARCDAGGE
jgi:hypothetical protein